MDESLITRSEVEGLLFGVADLVAIVTAIERWLREDGDAEEDDEG